MSYSQEVYDAVRSKFHMPDIDGIIRQQFDTSFMQDQIKNAYCEAAYEQMRPCVLFRPKLYPDGDHWCALYGDDLQHGVCGFGATPTKAMYDFDKNWAEQDLSINHFT